jgi:hypothetical protein
MTTTTDIDIDQIEAELQNDPIYWEAVKEEAEAVLASLKPSSKSKRAICARQHLAEYSEWKRTYLVPRKQKGKWAQTAEGYRIKTAKRAKIGDTCLVKMKSGEQRVFVLDEGGEGLWLGHRIDGDNA